MEQDPSLNINEQQPQLQELLPPPTGRPLYEWELGDLPVDPTTNNYENQDLNSVGEEQLEPVDVGSIDMAPIGEVIDNLRVSYHGLRYSISRVREQRARNKASRIISDTSRKDLMYKELSRAADARNNPVFETKKERKSHTEDEQKRAAAIATPTIRPKTFVEKRMDARQDRKRRKSLERELDARIVAKGYKSSNYLEGASTSEKIKGRIKVATSGMSAAEKREARHDLGAKTNTTPTHTQRIVQKRSESATRQFEQTKRQPIAARYRAFRRHSALDTVARQQRRAQEHLQKAIDIKNS